MRMSRLNGSKNHVRAAVDVCRELQQEFKVEHIETGLADHDVLSFYRQGEFIDLCRGPHIRSPKRIGAFKLLVGRGRVLEGGCLAPAVAAPVRNRLSFALRIWTSIWSDWQRPNGATIACSGNGCDCSTPTRASAPA